MIMLVAVNKQNQIVLAEEALLKQEGRYYCPGCHQEVFIKNGRQKLTHFCHYAGSDCQQFAEGETVEHVEGKLLLQALLEATYIEVKLEPYLPELQQRPDLLVIDKRLVIEFQCSPIPMKHIIERTRGYQSAGYEVIWIVGHKLIPKQSLTSAQKALLYQGTYSQVGLYHLNIDKKCVVVYRPVYNSFSKQQATLEDLRDFKEFLSLDDNKPIQTSNRSVEELHHQLEKESFYQNKSLMPFLSQLYADRESLISIPRELYYPLEYDWIVATHAFEWKYSVLKWIESLSTYVIITPKLMKRWLKKQVALGKIVFYETPMLSRILQSSVIDQFLNELVCTNVLRRVDGDKYCRQSKAQRFNNLKNKFV